MPKDANGSIAWICLSDIPGCLQRKLLDFVERLKRLCSVLWSDSFGEDMWRSTGFRSLNYYDVARSCSGTVSFILMSASARKPQKRARAGETCRKGEWDDREN